MNDGWCMMNMINMMNGDYDNDDAWWVMNMMNDDAWWMMDDDRMMMDDGWWMMNDEYLEYDE